jgi:tetratricopeptide (TPR) repeat protein
MDIRPEQLLERARERFGLHDYHGAIHLVEDLIAAGRAYADAYNLLGLCYQLVDQPERALEALERALRENPRYVEALTNRGVVLASVGRSDEAAQSFAAARSAGGAARNEAAIPEHLAARLANKHAALGEAYAEAGRLGTAIDEYKRALALGPSYHDLRYRMGQLMLEVGRTLEAREAFEVVRDARPKSANVQASFGLACYLSGDASSARVVWQAMRGAFPSDPRPRAYLAMLERGGE